MYILNGFKILAAFDMSIYRFTPKQSHKIPEKFDDEYMVEREIQACCRAGAAKAGICAWML